MNFLLSNNNFIIKLAFLKNNYLTIDLKTLKKMLTHGCNNAQNKNF